MSDQSYCFLYSVWAAARERDQGINIIRGSTFVSSSRIWIYKGQVIIIPLGLVVQAMLSPWWLAIFTSEIFITVRHIVQIHHYGVTRLGHQQTSRAGDISNDSIIENCPSYFFNSILRKELLTLEDQLLYKLLEFNVRYLVSVSLINFTKRISLKQKAGHKSFVYITGYQFTKLSIRAHQSSQNIDWVLSRGGPDQLCCRVRTGWKVEWHHDEHWTPSHTCPTTETEDNGYTPPGNLASQGDDRIIYDKNEGTLPRLQTVTEETLLMGTAVSRTLVSFKLSFNLHLNEAKFGCEKLQSNSTFICLPFFWSKSKWFHLYKANIQNWLISRKFILFPHRLKIFVSDKGSSTANQMADPANSGNKMQKSHG